ncbi:L-serine ammonia-lyase [Janthinobacterium agaricidamnosum]|uniref:L-serine dehydratase n=1 Tax=Janthinobacterium agaricidamnosum NBRC 102515 = DSM 9628 TaxID=1349767 RepID=W0V5Z9_9BURK|nr:L-serine ammonia-lyase [Janthinobacterium agaricidamnosum]CDG83005.1 L-serine ammonia-lyase [Janthinobacterium agaricidamnosum NBRC 102515 = DSM 9628]
MDMSVFDLFKIGIGPSSSHTVGPMVAARRFLIECGSLEQAVGVEAALYGSLALTGVGHATDKAVILGLMGETPQGVVPDQVDTMLAAIEAAGAIRLLGTHAVPFSAATGLVWHKSASLPEHPNGMRFTLKLADGSRIEQVFYSVGGGFIHAAGEAQAKHDAGQATDAPHAPAPGAVYPFDTMDQLLAHGKASGLSIPDMLRTNECVKLSNDELNAGLDRIWHVMRDCIAHGLDTPGQLPGGLNVKRRAANLWRQAQDAKASDDRANDLPHDAVHLVSLYAMAVNEENAAGGRVVTAPTNGAAGIIPAVLRYYAEDCRPSDPVSGVRRFMLTAAAIGMLCKRNASISGAEIGCQGEVGVACAMAAAGLVAALGGSNEQIENAAEIGIEHHLGMTCDPIGGLVQIPCIERNGMGAVKAITAASLALKGDGTHFVSLDEVIETMRQTGADMQDKYKETSLGGLAIHVITVNHAAC